MCLDLYRGLELNLVDLSKCGTSLAGFDGKLVMPARQIRLPVVAGGKEVLVDFIVVHAYSPYLKVKFPTKQGVV